MRPRTTISFLAVLATLMVCAVPARAALDLTGTWEGTWSCKDVTNGEVLKPTNTLTMTVTQSGSDVYAVLTWDGYNASNTFQGYVQELTDKPGQGAATIISCATNTPPIEYTEALSAMVKVRPTNVKPANATFKATSTYEGAPVTVGGVCKYSLKRVSLADPGVAACPAAAACGNGTIESPEMCEVANLNGNTCQTQGLAGGTLRCATGCTLDTSGCWATRWVNHGDGTATDNTTGLRWELKTDDGTVHDKDDRYTWGSTSAPYPPTGTAFTDFIARLNGSADGVCFTGKCDWRLPTRGELQGIVDDGAAPGCGSGVPCTTIPGLTVPSGYWSSSTADSPGFAWILHFGGGFTLPDFKADNLYVRAVRGGS